MSELTVWWRQQESDFYQLVAAQRQKYDDYKLWRGIWIAATTTLALGGTLLVAISNPFTPIVALVSTMILIGEYSILRLIIEQRKEAARIQEKYDCELLRIPWNETFAQRPDTEGITAAANKRIAKVDKKEEKGLREWYPKNSADRPLRKARILCQKVNLWWDSKLRAEWMWVVGFGVAALIVTTVLIAVRFDIALSDFLAGPLLLILPVVSSGVENLVGHRTPAGELKELKGYAESLLAKAEDRSVSDEELAFDSRLLQDRICHSRKESPSVPSWFYNLRRGSQQAQADQLNS